MSFVHFDEVYEICCESIDNEWWFFQKENEHVFVKGGLFYEMG